MAASKTPVARQSDSWTKLLKNSKLLVQNLHRDLSIYQQKEGNIYRVEEKKNFVVRM